MLGLVPFLQASGIAVKPESLKIHLAGWNGVEHPLHVFFAGHFPDWQSHQTKRNFGCAQVLSLIDLGKSAWLFVGVYEVLGCIPHPQHEGHFLYTMQLLPNQDDLIGRIVVTHERTRQAYIWLKDIRLPIHEIRPQKMTIGDFPGFNHVRITYAELQIIVQQQLPSWKSALGNVKGVYLITDTTTGNHYVGKASGEVGLWQRWCDYATNGHGGNKYLKALLAEHGPAYASHFQYAILEIADTHASEQDIQAREQHWMRVLGTRAFGLN